MSKNLYEVQLKKSGEDRLVFVTHGKDRQEAIQEAVRQAEDLGYEEKGWMATVKLWLPHE